MAFRSQGQTPFSKSNIKMVSKKKIHGYNFILFLEVVGELEMRVLVEMAAMEIITRHIRSLSYQQEFPGAYLRILMDNILLTLG